MKVIEAEFLEPVRSPVKGVPGDSGMMLKVKFTDGGTLKGHMLPGVCLILESETVPNATIVPWTNVRFALTDRASAMAALDRRPAKRE